MVLLLLGAQTSRQKCPDKAFPEGYSYNGNSGWMVTDPYAKVPQYSLSHASDKHGEDVLFLFQLLKRDEMGCPYWKVVYSFKLPKQPPGTALAIECRVNGVYDRAVFAYANIVNEPIYTTLVHAWRVMIELEKIVEIPTDGIVCTNEGYGL